MIERVVRPRRKRGGAYFSKPSSTAELFLENKGAMGDVVLDILLLYQILVTREWIGILLRWMMERRRVEKW